VTGEDGAQRRVRDRSAGLKILTPKMPRAPHDNFRPNFQRIPLQPRRNAFSLLLSFWWDRLASG
jgi:hypothetical protein